MGAQDRVVVIIGASRGIGRATALTLAGRRASLVVVARDPQALAVTAEQCRARGSEVLEIVGDISAPGVMADIVDRTVRRFGRIDVWLGIAGVVAYGGVDETPPEVYRRVMDINLHAHVEGVQQVLPVMRAQGRGRIVLVGSLYSRITSPLMSPYTASKFALLAFTRSLRQELLGTGIDVRIVLPATIDTPIYQRAANFTGRVARPLPPVSSAWRVARAIAKASRGRGPRAHYVGRLQSSMVLLSGVTPRVYDRFVRVLIRTIALTRTPAEDTLGGLETLPSDRGSVGGGWRSPALRAALVLAGAAGATSLIGRRRRR
jgi:NAD(P)-dependent dehydrogenase (short-subunit alcohol dehydrogenase family)